MNGELYALKNVRRVFGQREVLAIDSLTIEPGRIYGLVGPNGSGKTTLMKIMAFLDEPTSGDIFFEGRKASRRDMGEFRSKVVWSPQFPVMFTGSLRYNIEYPMRLRGVPAAQRRRRSNELLEQVGLLELAEAPARRLSGGEAQRASLARALAAQAEVLLLDEPTANVDAASRSGLVTLIEDLWRDRGLSMIITTHDHSLEAELCQNRIYLGDGKLVSLHEAAIHSADLLERDGRLCLTLPPEAALPDGAAVSIQQLTAHDNEVLLHLQAADRRIIRARLRGEAAISAARQLTLTQSLSIQNSGG
ncbi:MAG: ATP-binding cassette domain-containing protein [Candidatus Adiutrix sp.]|jgi:ABC-type multidrug transport system ATPase subunit|nr:ATP-binding cassette domain-containing protein [Candidatus Adiutrix sp.]